MTECTRVSFDFPPVKRRRIEARFSGGDITSDGGRLLLRQADRRPGLLEAVKIHALSPPISTAMPGSSTTRSTVPVARWRTASRMQQPGLFADRTSAHPWWTHQFHLLLSSLACVLMESIRWLALHDTELAHAQVGTLRLKLLKIGAIILRNTRRIRFLLSSAFPCQNLFYATASRLVPG